LRLIFLTIALLAMAPLAIAQEREWTLNASDKEAFLVFGVPDTDDVGLSLWCEIGTNKLSVFINNVAGQLKQNQTTNMIIEVDGQQFHVKAKASVDKAGNSKSIEGQVPSNAPLLKAAESGTTLKTTIQNHTNTYPLIDANITGLLRTCAGDVVN
jgi:hypothetical protein